MALYIIMLLYLLYNVNHYAYELPRKLLYVFCNKYAISWSYGTSCEEWEYWASEWAGSTSRTHYSRSSSSQFTSINSEAQKNIVLFGLSETYSLLELKDVIDEMLQLLVGKPVAVNDIMRIGRVKRESEAAIGPQGPCPVLIKLDTVWNRRLVLVSKCKLKDFRIERLFIREDLSFEARRKLAELRLAKVKGNANTSTSNLSQPGVTPENTLNSLHK